MLSGKEQLRHSTSWWSLLLIKKIIIKMILCAISMIDCAVRRAQWERNTIATLNKTCHIVMTNFDVTQFFLPVSIAIGWRKYI